MPPQKKLNFNKKGSKILPAPLATNQLFLPVLRMQVDWYETVRLWIIWEHVGFLRRPLFGFKFQLCPFLSWSPSSSLVFPTFMEPHPALCGFPINAWLLSSRDGMSHDVTSTFFLLFSFTQREHTYIKRHIVIWDVARVFFCVAHLWTLKIHLAWYLECCNWYLGWFI